MDKNGLYVMAAYFFGILGMIGFSMWVRYQMKSIKQFLMMNKDESDPT